MKKLIQSDAITFRDAFLSEATQTNIDLELGAVLRVLLFYLWRGCSLARESGINGKTDPYASLISQSAYEETLAVLQLIRMGYQADAVILSRALMERIAIVGFLGENRDLLPRYYKGNLNPYKEALSWAKKKSLPNWMRLYSILSGITHSAFQGPAGHIHNKTMIGRAFRHIPNKDLVNDADMTEELFGLVVYSMLALDSFALTLIQDSNTLPFAQDTEMVLHTGLKDFKEFGDFLQRLADRYKNQTK